MCRVLMTKLHYLVREKLRKFRSVQQMSQQSALVFCDPINALFRYLLIGFFDMLKHSKLKNEHVYDSPLRSISRLLNY